MICLAADTYLLRAGDAATCAYLIEQGSMEVLLEQKSGERLIAVLGPGEIVGEMALIDHAPRTASVRSREECLLLPITEENIAKRLAAADPLLRLVLGTVLDRFRATLHDASGDVGRSTARNTKRSHVAAAAREDLRLEQELGEAFADGQIMVHYQPIVRLATGRLAGFEALARWAHPTRGLVPPSMFIPLAEASGLSGPLACACLLQVTSDLAALQEAAASRPAHVEGPRVAVNISGQDLTTFDLVRSLSAIVENSKHSTDMITLELTETALVHSPMEAAEKLREARRLGFKVAVDDFGTGYSSLNYVRMLPIDSLKIDQAFVQSMMDCATTRSIVVSMLRLAETLNVKVVGEGIETHAQRSLLQMLGCEFGQGYLFGRPLPLHQTLELMRNWRASAVDAAICATAA